VQNLSYEDKFDLHENESVGAIHFHMNGFSQKTCFDTERKGNSELAYWIFRRSTKMTVHFSREKPISINLSISFRKHSNEKKENSLFTLIIKMKILFARAIIIRQRLALVLCFYRVIETRFLTNHRAYFVWAVF